MIRKTSRSKNDRSA